MILIAKIYRKLWSLFQCDRDLLVQSDLTGSVWKHDIIERLMGMAKIGTSHKPVCDDDWSRKL